MISKLWEVISILLTFLMLFLATASKLSIGNSVRISGID